jgi:hypothetical protein
MAMLEPNLTMTGAIPRDSQVIFRRARVDLPWELVFAGEGAAFLAAELEGVMWAFPIDPDEGHG